jgi:hypothetical protein
LLLACTGLRRCVRPTYLHGAAGVLVIEGCLIHSLVLCVCEGRGRSVSVGGEAVGINPPFPGEHHTSFPVEHHTKNQGMQQTTCRTRQGHDPHTELLQAVAANLPTAAAPRRPSPITQQTHNKHKTNTTHKHNTQYSDPTRHVPLPSA